MPIRKTTWLAFILLSAVCLGLWSQFSYPFLTFVNFSVGRQQAATAAKNYLRSLNVNTEEFKTAVVFREEKNADQYLQKTLGFKKLIDFVKKENFDLFFWNVRRPKRGRQAFNARHSFRQ
jgi:hypothetical protein